MAKSTQSASLIEVHPATAERWEDLETLFGEKGAYAGCWCTWWRLKHAEFHMMTRESRKALLKDLTCKNQVPGVLAYTGGEPSSGGGPSASGTPVGWCSIGPRESYISLEASQTLKRIDNMPVWSIVCFFILKPFRHQGVMEELLRGAVQYAGQQGASIVEGYPIDLQSPKLAGKKLSRCEGYMGIASAFREAGFVEVGRASETQLIMRYTIR